MLNCLARAQLDIGRSAVSVWSFSQVAHPLSPDGFSLAFLTCIAFGHSDNAQHA
jgi:hypothetical protein